LPRAVFVERAGLRGLLGFLAKLLNGESNLGDERFVLLQDFLVAGLATGQFPVGQAQFIDLALECGDTSFVAAAIIVLAEGGDGCDRPRTGWSTGIVGIAGCCRIPIFGIGHGCVFLASYSGNLEIYPMVWCLYVASTTVRADLMISM
jgi:hypothetical protein